MYMYYPYKVRCVLTYKWCRESRPLVVETLRSHVLVADFGYQGTGPPPRD